MSFAKLDAKWLAKWATMARTPRASAPKFYQLPMFPYPSGRLHVGHLRVFTISDTLARFRRMRGFEVIHPMGWDAFGLPAENAALQNGVDAEKWTYDHIFAMRAQVQRMLTSFDWSREVITCAPDYYKHTQQIFLWLFERGLVYRKRAMVNWDPVDKTVLANEQIDAEGRSWRSGALAEQKMLEQWFVKITDYAEELVRDLDLLERWPEKVKSMQRQWIRLSEGFELDFDGIKVFTTRPETLPAVQFIAVSPQHPAAIEHAATSSGLIENLKVRHPLTGQRLPVYVADYVVDYGTRAVMGVPALDERDQEFWKSVGGAQIDTDQAQNMLLDAPSVDALAVQGSARRVQHMHLHDWLISRQRFWGAPIPVVHCPDCGVVPVPSSELPVELPRHKTTPLAANPEWIRTSCPSCGGPAERDTDTMDTFMDSSWYYLRYLDPHNAAMPFSNTVSKEMPVDCYVGGVEHAILHLLYARFIYKFLLDTGKLDGTDFKEPFARLITLGMVHGKTYVDEHGKYLTPAQAQHADPATVTVSMEKMSKSKLNGVDPLDVIDKHGADAVRAHMLFQAPVDKTLDWDDTKIVGIERWMRRVEGAVSSVTDCEASELDPALRNSVAKTVGGITSCLESSLNLNTVISDYMKLTNLIAEVQDLGAKRTACQILVRLMAPVLPAFADEMHARLEPSTKESVHALSWPELEPVAEKRAYKVVIGKRVIRVDADSRSNEAAFLELAGVARSSVASVEIKHGSCVCIIRQHAVKADEAR